MTFCGIGHAAVVAPDGSGDFKTISGALNSGATDIRIKPGTYKELLVIDRPHVHLRGLGAKPQDVVLSYDLSAGTAGGTTKSASVTVSGDDFYAENLTIENTFSRTRPLAHEGSQAVALKVTGDRASLPTAFYAEYHSTGLGAASARRELTEAEAPQFGRQKFLAGDDNWDPTKVH